MRVVIFCGGFGTRMWPASRKSFPKQFYPLIKGKSFFELTYERFRKAFKPSEIFVSTEQRYVKFIKDLAPSLSPENIISEPERKDNLAAVGLVCAILEKRFPGEVMIVSWSDHLIGREAEFLKAISAAADYAQISGLIVSVDEKPKYPSVYNGWVKMGEEIEEYKGHRIVKITKHIEKPEETMAKKMFTAGGYLLNTGYRAWRTDVMLSYYKEFIPEMYEGLMKITNGSGKSYNETILYREYHKFVKDSVEKVIFEKLNGDKRVTIPVDVDWRDAGTWELFYKALKNERPASSAYKAMKTKESETVVEGGVYLETLESDRNLIIGPKGKTIALIGVTDLVIIDTPDALLISRMDKTSEVKEIFAKLEEKKPEVVE